MSILGLGFMCDSNRNNCMDWSKSSGNGAKSCNILHQLGHKPVRGVLGGLHFIKVSSHFLHPLVPFRVTGGLKSIPEAAGMGMGCLPISRHTHTPFRPMGNQVTPINHSIF